MDVVEEPVLNDNFTADLGVGLFQSHEEFQQIHGIVDDGHEQTELLSSSSDAPPILRL